MTWPKTEVELRGNKTFSKTMRKMWVQFAKTGNPSLPKDISPDGKVKE